MNVNIAVESKKFKKTKIVTTDIEVECTCPNCGHVIVFRSGTLLAIQGYTNEWVFVGKSFYCPSCQNETDSEVFKGTEVIFGDNNKPSSVLVDFNDDSFALKVYKIQREELAIK
ncbi:hypothetical protein [Photobacterium kishitanii]|uniref:Uncharacterized protein n=1 Tax=Photobacterium kishitanii TaxID=318456 RepID=A0A2T3KLM9_9GAMM|nr:hypothetical protein [Photobacterium kishitanii]PSV00563.1 hypothetical protein C9J27_05355 [Photobacterium kishitanii]